MEKKLYMQPELIIVNIALNTLMEASNPTYNPNTTFSEEESVGSRRNVSLWDDEEEYEDEY